ncbi:MAG TPA: SRPBCC family protein [Actinomycetota bacterium]|jgi:hypothetical protein
MLTRYRFRHTWLVREEPERAFDVLADLGTYPSWWPQIREVRRIDADRASVRVLAYLPYTLRLRLHRRVQDRRQGLLEVAIAGDLEGFARWRIEPGDGGAVLLYEQEVRTRKRSLNVLAPVARWAFILNHRAMMRSGERGLRSFLRRPAGTAG